MTWALLFLAILTILTSSPKEKNRHYFEKHHIKDLTVVFMDKKTINTWWKMIGGQRDWEKVHAFSYYDHKKDKYYIILPPNADHKLIGYEFSHILEWSKKEKIRQVKSEKASFESKIN